MTREKLVRIIYFSMYCSDYNYHNCGKIKCQECAEKTLTEYENEIYNKALEDFFNKCWDKNIMFYSNPIDCLKEVKEQLKKGE